MSELARELIASGFFLGGSRRMNELYPHAVPIKEGTDWDLYCADQPDKIDALRQKGFSLIEASNRSYWDSLLIDIWKHKSENVEVLVRSNVERYKDCFDSIHVDEYVNRLWKSNPSIQTKNHPAFRASVCAYFNYLFANCGNPEPDDLPF